MNTIQRKRVNVQSKNAKAVLVRQQPEQNRSLVIWEEVRT